MLSPLNENTIHSNAAKAGFGGLCWKMSSNSSTVVNFKSGYRFEASNSSPRSKSAVTPFTNKLWRMDTGMFWGSGRALITNMQNTDQLAASRKKKKKVFTLTPNPNNLLGIPKSYY